MNDMHLQLRKQHLEELMREAEANHLTKAARANRKARNTALLPAFVLELAGDAARFFGVFGARMNAHRKTG